MKRLLILLLGTVACFGTVWKAHQSAAVRASQSPAALSRYVPSGALLYLQAQDFSALLSAWDNSREKKNWLQSGNYTEFSNSRLFLRLADAAKEFSSTAGVPTDSKLLRQMAGTQSALVVYDIGKLEFLYLTRLPSASAAQSALWQTRSKFETRSVGNVTFFVRKDSESGREVAFAVTGDYLLLATREELLVGTLRLLANENVPAITGEPWWSQSVAEAGPDGDLRMVLNLEKIVPSPYFRSYWIQRNITDMKQYSAAVSDLFRSGNEFREERVLLRRVFPAADSDTSASHADVTELLRYVPADAGVYQAKANPAQAECVAALETKIFSARVDPTREQKFAPQVQLSNGQSGDSADLETRIDQSPLQAAAADTGKSSLEELLAENPANAMLQVQSTELNKDGVFVRVHSAVILRGTADWNESGVKSLLTDFAQANVATQKMGFAWQQDGGQLRLNGLWTLALAIRGKYLFISDSPELLGKLLANSERPVTEQSATFVAGFDHQREQEKFTALTEVLDSSQHVAGGHAQPSFFTDTIGSLSSTLHELTSQKIVVRDQGGALRQTVTYVWAH